MEVEPGKAPSGGPLCIVLGNEPRAYRELLAAAFCSLRPHVASIVVEPPDLDAAIACYAPRIVVCSTATKAAQEKAVICIELYPGGDAETIVFMQGQRSTVATMELHHFLTLIDQQERELAHKY